MLISKEGSHLLTIQFLCTLQEEDDGVSFHFFGREYQLSWKNLSLLLGFHRKCIVDFDKAVRDFKCHSFWTSISGQVIVGKFYPCCNDIHNPTLRLMHKWLALSLFPREDVRLVRNDELKILYAMVKKIRVSPIKPMIAQWLEHFKMTGPIKCTSLITRIASKVRALDGAPVPFIQTPHTIIDEAHLVQGHTLKHDAN